MAKVAREKEPARYSGRTPNEHQTKKILNFPAVDVNFYQLGGRKSKKSIGKENKQNIK
jgi:hypothetical protein